jgi:hypothetical protein
MACLYSFGQLSLIQPLHLRAHFILLDRTGTAMNDDGDRGILGGVGHRRDSEQKTDQDEQ